MSEQAQTEKKSAVEMMLGYFRDFKVLKETRSEYWGVQVINFIDCTIYFAMISIAAVFLSSDLGLDDKQAGYALTIFTTATTIFLFFSGMFTDWLGIRVSLYVSMGVMLFLRLGMVVIGLVDTIPNRGLIATVLFFLMAPFMAMIQTSFQAANKRFTTTRSRSSGFMLWYLFMNVGAMLGGLLIDFVRKILQIPNAHIFSFGVLFALLCLLTTALMVRREEQLLGPEEMAQKEKEAARDAAQGKSMTGEKVAKKKPLQIAKEVLAESAFWKLAVLITLLLGVRAVFTYMYLLAPKYWLRVIGPDAAMGTLQAINPFLIIIGIILFIPIANKFNIFSMLTNGAMISACCLFALVLPWQMFSSDIATAHYMMAILFLVLLTVGEIIWSPKLNEYTAAIAPPGQEGTYLGLTMVPWFAAKTGVSLLSGHMLEKWSPESVQVKASQILATAQQNGFGATELAANMPAKDLADQARNFGMDPAALIQSFNLETVTAQAQTFGINAADFMATVNPRIVTEQAKAMGLTLGALDPAQVGLQFKVLSLDVAQKIFDQVNPNIDTVGVSLKFAMENGWTTFWTSPPAMWLVLGGVAVGGVLIAMLLRGWLTKGARWKIEHSDHDTRGNAASGNDDPKLEPQGDA